MEFLVQKQFSSKINGLACAEQQSSTIPSAIIQGHPTAHVVNNNRMEKCQRRKRNPQHKFYLIQHQRDQNCMKTPTVFLIQVKTTIVENTSRSRQKRYIYLFGGKNVVLST